MMNDELQAAYDNQSHATDIDLMCQTSWGSVHSFDWGAKVPNTTVDVIRGIQIGQTKSKEGIRMVMIRFVDTEVDRVQPRGGAWYNWQEIQPSVWAIAFTAPEVRSLAQLVDASNAKSLMIHREPWTEPSSWYSEAQWILDEHTRDILGVRIAVQASQDLVPKIHEVRFLTKGHYFRFTSCTDVSPDSWDFVSTSYHKAVEANKLPPDQEPGPTTWKPATAQILIRTDYVADGESSIEAEIESKSATTYMFQSSHEPDNVVQVVTSGKVTLRNPTKNKMYLQSVTTEYSTGNGPFSSCHDSRDCPATRIGAFSGTHMVWGIPHADVSWKSEGTSWELPPTSVHEICIQAAVVVPKATTFCSKPFDIRLHPQLQEPLTVRATFLDNEKRKKIICWDYSNSVLDARDINSYEDVLANEKCCQQEGVGADYECLVFLHWDDPSTFMRTYLVVTKAKDTTEWYIRAADTAGMFPTSGYTKVAATSFQRLVYDAPDQTSLDKSTDWSSSAHCKLMLLLDPKHKVVYGLVAQIVATDSDVIKMSKSVYLDQSSK